jgi:hypothetical protein
MKVAIPEYWAHVSNITGSALFQAPMAESSSAPA